MTASCKPAEVIHYRHPQEMMAAFPRTHIQYEQNDVLLLADAGIGFDRDFIGRTNFPPDWKKIGTVNGITLPPLVLQGNALVRSQNPLCSAVADNITLLKLYSELIRIEFGFKLLVTQVLPAYWNASWMNCTFRFTKTEDEPAHLDSFSDGARVPPRLQHPRLKFFLNVDAEPRVWNIGPTLPDILRHTPGCLESPLPTDLNVLCARVNAAKLSGKLPMARVEIPPGGIVFANGATVLHQVVSGNRMVCLEGFVPRTSLQPASTCEWDLTRSWIEGAGYEAVDEPDPS
jgi:hypothetical protein